MLRNVAEVKEERRWLLLFSIRDDEKQSVAVEEAEEVYFGIFKNVPKRRTGFHPAQAEATIQTKAGCRRKPNKIMAFHLLIGLSKEPLKRERGKCEPT